MQNVSIDSNVSEVPSFSSMEVCFDESNQPVKNLQHFAESPKKTKLNYLEMLGILQAFLDEGMFIGKYKSQFCIKKIVNQKSFFLLLDLSQTKELLLLAAIIFHNYPHDFKTKKNFFLGLVGQLFMVSQEDLASLIKEKLDHYKSNFFKDGVMKRSKYRFEDLFDEIDQHKVLVSMQKPASIRMENSIEEKEPQDVNIITYRLPETNKKKDLKPKKRRSESCGVC